MRIIKTDKSNITEWVELSVKLFPDHTFDEMYRAYHEFLTTKKEIGFLYHKDNKIVAFMNLSIRSDYVNGTDTSPVVFVEEIYVLPEYRKQGIAREFISFAEKFTKESGFTQLASDCLIENTASEQFHKSCGFEANDRAIRFYEKCGFICDGTTKDSGFANAKEIRYRLEL